MKSIDYQEYFRNPGTWKKERFFFFTYEDEYLLKKGIEFLLKTKNISSKEVFLGKEIKVKSIIERESKGDMFSGSSNIQKTFLIFNAEKVSDIEEIDKNAIVSSTIIFVFFDQYFLKRTKKFRDLKKVLHVHFPKFDLELALKWFKRELSRENIREDRNLIKKTVYHFEGSLTDLNNVVNLLKLGGKLKELLRERVELIGEYETIFRVKREIQKNYKKVPMIWKLFDSMLYNRKVKYDFEKELKYIIRRFK
jgi:DNA polymerase III delta subunit